MPDILYDINALANILLAGVTLYWSIRVYECGMLPRWLYAAFWAACLGWIVLYAIVIFGNSFDLDSITFGRIFVRPLVTLTLGCITATFIYRAKQCPTE